jgi:hypothetical protein
LVEKKKELFCKLKYIYESESKIIRNVGSCCAVGYTAGWA